MKKQLLKAICAIFILINTQARAQLSPEQEARVKATSIKFCTMMSRLAANPRDDEAFGALVEGLFHDAGGGLVYDDFLNGEVMIPFIEYTGKVKSYQGQLSFAYSGHEYYYLYTSGLELGIVLVKKQVKGSRMQYEVLNALVVDANTGKVREIGKRLPPGAVRLGQSLSSQPQQPTQTVVSTRPKADLPNLPEMVYVEGGTFMMGCTDEQGSDCREDEKPAHKVTLDGFYIGKYEVTNEQFVAFLNVYGGDVVKDGEYKGQKMIDPYQWGVEGFGDNWRSAAGYENHPVVYVTWYGANEYCRWLSAQTGQTWRLPTEAEWEYAARGGKNSQGTKYAGGNYLGSVGWYSENSSQKTHTVGQRAPNELGLYDMSGNVWEWCGDRYGGYTSSAQINPKASYNGGGRIVRGGSWYFIDYGCRVAVRLNSIPNGWVNDVGFRVCQDR